MPGSIVFRPLEANLTHNTEWIGKMDPYVVFFVGTHKVRTNVCRKGGKNPMWEDNVTVPVSNDFGSVLVEVKDKDIIIDDRIGSCEVDLREIETAGVVKKWFPLFHKEKPAGELLMEAVFTPTTGFGAPLGQPTVLPGVMGTGAPLQSGFVGAPLQSGFVGAPLQSGFVAGGVPLQTQGIVPTAGAKSTTEQFAEEALLRGIDPLHSHNVQNVSGLPIGTYGGSYTTNNLLNNNLPVTQSGYVGGQPGLIGTGLVNPGYNQLSGSNVPFNVHASGLKKSELPMQHGQFVPVGTGLGSDYLTNTVTAIEKDGLHHGVMTPQGEPLTFGHHHGTTLIKEGLNPTTQGPIGTHNAETYNRDVKHV